MKNLFTWLGFVQWRPMIDNWEGGIITHSCSASIISLEIDLHIEIAGAIELAFWKQAVARFFRNRL